MIMTAEEFAVYYDSDKPANLINAKLKALESLVRKYTNNNFQKRAYRRTADIIGGLFLVEALTPFKPGDTVQITNSEMNEGLYTVKEVGFSTFSVNEDIVDEINEKKVLDDALTERIVEAAKEYKSRI